MSLLPPAYLAKKLTQPLPTKGGSVLRTIQRLPALRRRRLLLVSHGSDGVVGASWNFVLRVSRFSAIW
jgi:hypothetical protein